MSIKALDLFQAYKDNQLPQEGGYIVSSFFDINSAYSRYELVSYAGVKNIYLTEDGLSFQSDGKKIHILVEPPTYPRKHIEPFRRDKTESIPHRVSELTVFTARDQTKIMVSKEPIMTYSSFTILKPTQMNFAFVFFNQPDIVETINFFFQQTLNREAGVDQINAKEAARMISQSVEKLKITF